MCTELIATSVNTTAAAHIESVTANGTRPVRRSATGRAVGVSHLIDGRCRATHDGYAGRRPKFGHWQRERLALLDGDVLAWTR
jgi:hypothetical protein